MARSCVIFDFDGVIADTEAQHLIAYNEALLRLADKLGTRVRIAPASYYQRYIAFGNREGFACILRDAGLNASEPLLNELCALKDHIMDTELSQISAPLAGVTSTLASLTGWHVPLAICSGARRVEILRILEAFHLQALFQAIVAIEDVRHGKPDPEGYRRAFDTLQLQGNGELDKARSLVIEDTAGGAAAAHDAGLRVLGVATSSPLEKVKTWADFALPDLSHLQPGQLRLWLQL